MLEHWTVPYFVDNLFEAYLWCQKMFGPCGETWEHHGHGWFVFSQDKQLTMFLLTGIR
jgi:hypothetical protein